MGYVGNVKVGNTTLRVAHTLYGTCSTTSGTAAKVVTCADFDALVDGTVIYVYFTAGCTAYSGITMNVNNTGAKTLVMYGPDQGINQTWYVNHFVGFIYYNSQWIQLTPDGSHIHTYVTPKKANTNEIGTSGLYYKAMYSAAFTNPSSRKIKENISDMTEEEARKLLNVDIVKFDYKEEYGGNKNNYGVIAEDLNEVIPYAVIQSDSHEEDEESIPCVDYSKLVPYLVKVVQMQQKEIDELKKMIK